MYLYETKTGEAMQGNGMFTPRFETAEIAQADRVEVWATNFEDAGEYCEFRLMNGDTVINKSTIQGY
tara:strand:- start:1736 stop:1936 length:201 start_codon:yes stop_codon:yes gene_type:complete